MHGLIKTHKRNNTIRVITSSCNTVLKNLSTCMDQVFYDLSENISCRIKNSNHLFDRVHNVNSANLLVNTISVSFDIEKLFSSIDNKAGLDVAKIVLLNRSTNAPPRKFGILYNIYF